MACFLLYLYYSKQFLIFFLRNFCTFFINPLSEVIYMNVSGQRTFSVSITCPNLLEWTGWESAFCRLRYMVPDVLTSSEIQEYCRNDNYCRCVFYMNQLDMVSKTYIV